MKTRLVLVVAALGSGLCAAQEVGRVISSTPVVQQVAVPRQICSNESVSVPAQKSGAGVALGALAGGALGNAVGQGNGRAAATMLGIFGGAVLGDRIEGQGSQVQNVQRCTTQTVVENRVANYSVVYEYAGRQYTVQMPYDPGPSVRLQVTPVDAAPAPTAPLTYVQPPVTQTVYTQPVVVASDTIVYPAYYARPYYPPIGLNLQFGYSGGHGHYGHYGHWR